ncbi:hypothetical protein [Cellulomonas sp. KH9]|uniref:hypothetical protein n=1 Tax=Cellulomonas sp. KH9 TaxID=1855324 RepID=UPI0008EEC976|nr:hypothetical protein [Cellulomonas sp. KH9]SFK32220.1 hypothetical protein SAMN05216467_2881 [Cellulomonas sp. KH9]
MSEHPNPPLPPLTAEDFDSGSGYTFRGLPIIEDEDGTYVYTHGHVDPETFAAAVDDYDREVAGWLDDPCDADGVDHMYAVTLAGPPEWWMSWNGVTAETPGAFPITVVTR